MGHAGGGEGEERKGKEENKEKMLPTRIAGPRRMGDTHGFQSRDLELCPTQYAHNHMMVSLRLWCIANDLQDEPEPMDVSLLSRIAISVYQNTSIA